MEITTKIKLRKVLKFSRIPATLLAIGALLLVLLPILPAKAAMSNVKDTLSTLTDSANANHTISFVAGEAVANGATVTVTFPAGFDLTGVTEDDVDIAGTTEGELTTAADCSAAEDASAVIAGQVLTFTLCAGDGGDFTNSETITIEIGTNATASGTGANQIDNQTVAENNSDPVIDITADAAAGSLAVEIIADDSVNITAVVTPSITFSISDVAIGFGNLSASVGRWATADAAGTDASDPATPTAAHTLAVGTNSTSGWAITYNGATLTSGGNTIDAIGAAVDEDSDGTPGSEQFGISASTNGDSTIAAGYLRDGDSDWDFDAGATTTLASESVPTATETISVSYLANIAALTEAGNYQTDITYIATATF